MQLRRQTKVERQAQQTLVEETIEVADLSDLRSEVRGFLTPLSSLAARMAVAPSAGFTSAGRVAAPAAAGKSPGRQSHESVIAESESEA